MSLSAYDPKKHSLFESRHNRCTACVGDNAIGDFETYAAGYFDATKVLLSQVIEPQYRLTQDTLVYPTLYALRHGIELSIKHIAKELADAGLEDRSPLKVDHDLSSLWDGLRRQGQSDRRFTTVFVELDPVVQQMHEADPSAQEFRYGERRDGVPSFKGRQVVDLVTVLELARYAETRFEHLFYLCRRLADERRYGSFTPELNRDELEQLSKELPQKQNWQRAKKFEQVKTKWMIRYGLSGRAFSRALEFIRKHREFSANIGPARSFLALDSSTLKLLLSAAVKLREDRNKTGRKMVSVSEFPEYRAFDALGICLSPVLVGEVTAIFYLGRDGRLSEEYDSRLENHSRYSKDVTDKDLRADILHVFTKLNFAECMCRGLRMVGHHKVAKKYEVGIEAAKATAPPPSLASGKDMME